MLSDHQLTMLQEGGSVILNLGQRLDELLGGLDTLGIPTGRVFFANGVLVWIDEEDPE